MRQPETLNRERWRRAREQRVALFADAIRDETLRAISLHRSMNSLHEAYAIILEEVDELWGEVKKKDWRRSEREVLQELVQIAAMCCRAAVDLDFDIGPES